MPRGVRVAILVGRIRQDGRRRLKPRRRSHDARPPRDRPARRPRRRPPYGADSRRGRQSAGEASVSGAIRPKACFGRCIVCQLDIAELLRRLLSAVATGHVKILDTEHFHYHRDAHTTIAKRRFAREKADPGFNTDKKARTALAADRPGGRPRQRNLTLNPHVASLPEGAPPIGLAPGRTLG
jgi:hypothetical protein